jgi:hypothetical protein
MSQVEATLSVGPTTATAMLPQPVARTTPAVIVTRPGLLSRY